LHLLVSTAASSFRDSFNLNLSFFDQYFLPDLSHLNLLKLIIDCLVNDSPLLLQTLESPAHLQELKVSSSLGTVEPLLSVHLVSVVAHLVLVVLSVHQVDSLVLEQVCLILIILVQFHQVLAVIALVILPVLIILYTLIELNVMRLLLINFLPIAITRVLTHLIIVIFVMVIIVIPLEEVLLLIIWQ
jgi:hypothetical protein